MNPANPQDDSLNIPGVESELIDIANSIRAGEVDDPDVLDAYCESFAAYALDSVFDPAEPLLSSIANGGRVIAEALGAQRINQRLLVVAAGIRSGDVYEFKDLARYRVSFSAFAVNEPDVPESVLASSVRQGGLAIVDALDDIDFPSNEEIATDDLIDEEDRIVQPD